MMLSKSLVLFTLVTLGQASVIIPLSSLVRTVYVPTTYALDPRAYLNQPIKSSYRIQDELGGYDFGYSGGPSARNEIRGIYGGVVGSYHYEGPDKKLYRTYYTDTGAGLKVAHTNKEVLPGKTSFLDDIANSKARLVNDYLKAKTRKQQRDKDQ